MTTHSHVAVAHVPLHTDHVIQNLPAFISWKTLYNTFIYIYTITKLKIL